MQSREIEIAGGYPFIDDNVVYVGGYSHYRHYTPNVYITFLRDLDAKTGQERWRFSFPDTNFTTKYPTFSNRVVYVHYGNSLFAIDEVRGQLISRFELSSNVNSLLTVADDKLFVITRNGYLHAISSAP